MEKTVPREIVMMYKEDLIQLFEQVAAGRHKADDQLTTPEVMEKYQIKSKTTLHSYHKDGLRYIKGSPNRYRIADLESFFNTRRI